MEFEEGDYDESHGLDHVFNVIRETYGYSALWAYALFCFAYPLPLKNIISMGS